MWWCKWTESLTLKCKNYQSQTELKLGKTAPPYKNFEWKCWEIWNSDLTHHGNRVIILKSKQLLTDILIEQQVLVLLL